MRTILVLCGLTLRWAAAAYLECAALAEPIRHVHRAPQAEVAVLVERPKDFLGKTVSVAGTVQQQCKTMGCFFFLPAGKKTLRVDLEEIAMNAPRREGHPARVEGQMVPYGDGYQLFASAVEFE